MTPFILIVISMTYLIIGQLVMLSCDLELRTVCPRVWSRSWLYAMCAFIWPVIYFWVRIKWQMKKRLSRSI